MERFRVTDEDGGVRIDKYLTSVCEGLSRSYLQKLLKSGQVLVGGQGVKASYAVQEGDLIELEVPEAVEPEILAEPMDLDVLYEDEDIILINKPKGMVVHPAAGHYTHTLVNGLLDHCRGQLSGINGVMRPGIVHRIDMDTTGVIIACKNDLAHSCLAEQLKEHSITRRYQAIVHGVLKEDEGTVDAPIGRHPVERNLVLPGQWCFSGFRPAVRPPPGSRSARRARRTGLRPRAACGCGAGPPSDRPLSAPSPWGPPA